MTFPYSGNKFSGALRSLGLYAALILISVFYVNYARGAEPVIITLHQTPCTIVEAEVTPKHFVSHKSADCVRINKDTVKTREFKVLRLKAGKTVFRVTNDNVSYPLGFWLRGRGIGRLTLPSVAGGGLSTGATKDYTIELKPGRYVYSCPLNPTPDYPLIVE